MEQNHPPGEVENPAGAHLENLPPGNPSLGPALVTAALPTACGRVTRACSAAAEFGVPRVLP